MKVRIYHDHGTFRPFMTKLVVSFSFSQHGSHTLGKEGKVGGKKEMTRSKGKQS